MKNKTYVDVLSENPFNYDLNDLGLCTNMFSIVDLTECSSDLDYFCLAIQRELHLITAVNSFRSILMDDYDG